MKLTNKHGLPEAFVRFAEADPYTTGHADISVTTLIDSPRIRSLRKRFESEIEEDVSERIFALFGTALHKILEDHCAEDCVKEQRFYYKFLDKVLTGQVDLMEPSGDGYVIADYKTVRGLSLAIHPEGQLSWHKQLNCYAWLARKNGYKVKGAKIIALIRDWNTGSVKRDQRFPKLPVVEIPIEIWDDETVEGYITDRIKKHFEQEQVPFCTDEERWKASNVYALYEYKRDGSLKSRATKLFDSHSDAMSYMMEASINGEIVERHSEPVRCAGNFCGVAQFCNQYQNELAMQETDYKE